MGMELVRMRMPRTLRKPALAEEDGVDSGGVGGEACVISHQGLHQNNWSEKKTLSHIRTYIKVIDQKKNIISHQGLYRNHWTEKKTVDDGDDADVDADQHGTAAEPRPRQRHAPGGLRIRICGIIMIWWWYDDHHIDDEPSLTSKFSNLSQLKSHLKSWQSRDTNSLVGPDDRLLGGDHLRMEVMTLIILIIIAWVSFDFDHDNHNCLLIKVASHVMNHSPLQLREHRARGGSLRWGNWSFLLLFNDYFGYIFHLGIMKSDKECGNLGIPAKSNCAW